LLCPLAMLVVTSLEATELRNIVYDYFNVYVPVMAFQTAMMQELSIGNFYLEHVKTAAGFKINTPRRASPTHEGSPRSVPTTPTRAASPSPIRGKSPKKSRSGNSSPRSQRNASPRSQRQALMGAGSSSGSLRRHPLSPKVKKRDSMDSMKKNNITRSPPCSPRAPPSSPSSSPHSPTLSPKMAPLTPAASSSSLTPLPRSADRKK